MFAVWRLNSDQPSIENRISAFAELGFCVPQFMQRVERRHSLPIVKSLCLPIIHGLPTIRPGIGCLRTTGLPEWQAWTGSNLSALLVNPGDYFYAYTYRGSDWLLSDVRSSNHYLRN